MVIFHNYVNVYQRVSANKKIFMPKLVVQPQTSGNSPSRIIFLQAGPQGPQLCLLAYESCKLELYLPQTIVIGVINH